MDGWISLNDLAQVGISFWWFFHQSKIFMSGNTTGYLQQLKVINLELMPYAFEGLLLC